jgi:aminobenzoyl-glutamate utilization protein B
MAQRKTQSEQRRIKGDAQAFADETQTTYHRLSDAIWSHAELPMQEFRSSELLAEHLEAEGFDIERGVAGMPTAFVATASNGTGDPSIGILAEYDALPSLSQAAGSLTHSPLVDGAPGHGCTHNAMGATSAFTAVALKRVLEQEQLDGTIVLFGCPGEEALVSRPYMVREGVFDGLDAVLDNHGADVFRPVAGVSYSGMYSFVVTFHGRTAHAAGDPWHGISALHAVELMNHAVNMLREHLHYTARVHCVIPEGGRSPNVVPDVASVWYYVRDSDERVAEDFRKVLRCAEGAAIATGCTHKVRTYTGIHQNYGNRALADIMHENVAQVGMPVWSEEDVRFAKMFQKVNGLKQKGMQVNHGAVLSQSAKDFTGSGSSDVGEVTLVAPTASLLFPVLPREVCGHHWQTVSLSATPIAHKAITAAAKALTGTGIDLLCDPDRLKPIRDEFARLQKRMPYKSYLPEDATPPIDLNREAMAAVRSQMEPHYVSADAASPIVDSYPSG